MNTMFQTSESVSRGHPDKLADQISDAVLDAYIELDPRSHVACETLITKNQIVIAGEVTSHGTVNIPNIVHHVLDQAGYSSLSHSHKLKDSIHVYIHEQSPDIRHSVDLHFNSFKKTGAGDQGIVYGYACDETAHFMPTSCTFAHAIIRSLENARKDNTLSFLGPDAKTQVTVEYNEKGIPFRISDIVISTQHKEEISIEHLRTTVTEYILDFLASHLIDKNTHFLINPGGKFVLGGPNADTGLTGRKQAVDTYGTIGRMGGGAFSGKDPTKIDRSAAYMARFVAKNIVAQGKAKTCEITLAYAIGIPEPINISLTTFNTGIVSDEELLGQVKKEYDFSVDGIISTLELLRPIYFKTSWGGHFGRDEKEFTWEKLLR